MPIDRDLLAYVFSGFIVALFSWRRFNTPDTVRSSTRQGLYWWSAAGYVTSALLLFVVLAELLTAGPWRTALIGDADHPTFPAYLMAAIAMTTLVSSLPIIGRIDTWLLATFQSWGEIPAHVQRRAASLLPETLEITDADVATLRQAYEGAFSDTMTSHLRSHSGPGPATSEYAFTRVVKLYHELCRLSGDARYGSFFAESGAAFEDLRHRIEAFIRSADLSLSVATRLFRLQPASQYEELMQDRRDSFHAACRDSFAQLALFASRAVLRSEPNEGRVTAALRRIGFTNAEPFQEPTFPVHGLTLLGLGMFLYLIAASLVLPQLVPLPHGHVPVAILGRIAVARVAAIALTLFLVQRVPAFRRDPGSPHPFAGYLACGAAGAAVTLVFFLPFDWSFIVQDNVLDPDRLAAREALPIGISFLICTAVAFCCNDWPDPSRLTPAWLVPAEAAGCALIVLAGTFLILALVPTGAGWTDHHPELLALPAAMTLMIGAYVPHLYRQARTAAAARATLPAIAPLRPVPALAAA